LPVSGISKKDMAIYVDAGAREREASLTAVARHRFSPKTWLLNIFQKTKSPYD